jgi:hypothetical protein
MNREEKILTWLRNEIDTDKKELDKEKELLAKKIKKIQKSDIFKKEKISLWQRIKKVLMGI